MSDTTPTLLERALTANAWFSRISGVVLAVLSPWLADLAGVETWVLVVLGLGLIAYSLWLGAAAARRPINTTEAVIAIAADDVWVAAAAVIIFFLPDALTTGGRWALGAISLVVAGIGVAQAVGLAQMRQGERSAV